MKSPPTRGCELKYQREARNAVFTEVTPHAGCELKSCRHCSKFCAEVTPHAVV